MKRRDFLAVTGASALGAGATFRPRLSPSPRLPSQAEPFRMKYAPHFGMFRNHAKSRSDQLKFMHDQGFRALEDNMLRRRSPEEQASIGKELQALKMEMGVFVATMDFRKATFASNRKADTDVAMKEIKDSVDVAKRVGAKWATVVLGCYAKRLELDYQTANVIDNLKRAAEICEPSGLVLVLEPLNPWRDHPDLFLTRIPQAYQICKAVGSPSVKILDDLYHQQISEGNLIPNMNRAWDEIAYFQIGDNPGRKEPNTGEIHYKNVFKHIHKRGFQGILGMEHGNSMPGKEGEVALIQAYRDCDSF